MARGTRSATSGRTPLGIPTGGAAATDLNALIYRPRILLQNNGFTAPVRRMSLTSMVNNLKYGSSQAEIEAAIAETRKQLQQEDNYAEMLLRQIRSDRRRLLADGWGYFKDEDNLRARKSFESAEFVDERAPAPRFGQLIVDVDQKHYRRAITQLAKIVTYDGARAVGMPGLFEYDVSLQGLYSSEDDLRNALFELRQFAQRNPDTAPVQALYCYILWYSRYDDAMIEAAGIAARMKRTAKDPESAWARLHDHLQAARRKLELAKVQS